MEDEPGKQSWFACGAGLFHLAMAFEGLRFEALRRECAEWGGEEGGGKGAKKELKGIKTER